MPIKIEYAEMKNKRLELNITQQKLAELADVNIATIKALETNRNLTAKDNVQRICRVLDLDINKIFTEDYKITKVISLVNNKGGSGKTSTCANLAYSIMEAGHKVLLIDSDMQMNLMKHFGMPEERQNNLAKALLNEKNLTNYIVKTQFENIDFILSDSELSIIEMAMFTKIQRESILKNIITPIINAGKYDYILIDTSPYLAMLNFNVINASDFVIIPVQLNAFGLHGLENLFAFFEQVGRVNQKFRSFNTDDEEVHEKENLCILINNYDVRDSIKKTNTEQNEEVLRNNAIKNKYTIFKTIIKVDAKLETAQNQQQPVSVYDRSSRIAKEFRELAKEVLRIVK